MNFLSVTQFLYNLLNEFQCVNNSLEPKLEFVRPKVSIKHECTYEIKLQIP